MFYDKLSIFFRKLFIILYYFFRPPSERMHWPINIFQTLSISYVSLCRYGTLATATTTATALLHRSRNASSHPRPEAQCDSGTVVRVLTPTSGCCITLRVTVICDHIGSLRTGFNGFSF